VTAVLFAAAFAILGLYGRGLADIAVRYAVGLILLLFIFKERKRLVVLVRKG
jgi:hypothetical protein